MAVRFVLGDLLTGNKIKWLSPSAGSWSEELNDSGTISVTVPLTDPVNKRMDLFNSAPVGKVFLAAVDGDTVLQAGPVWTHDFDGTHLTMQALGMWSYFDHRVLLPVLAGRLPTDATTDTRFSDVVSDANDPGYPWPVDTRESLLTIAKRLVEQAQSWTYGNVPVILPSEEAGDAERWYKGSDLGFVGDRLRQITEVQGGPDIMFTPQWKTGKTGIEWIMRIGTASEPMLFSQQRQTFQVGVAKSSISDLKVFIDGRRLASHGFGSAGSTVEKALSAVQSSTTLTAAGFAQFDAVDKSHSTVSELPTIQGYTDVLVNIGAQPSTVWSFSHNFVEQTPTLGAFNAGDFATVRVRESLYVPDGRYTMRLLTRSGRLGSDSAALNFAPEVI